MVTIHEITIRIVFDHKSVWVKPVVEYLTTQNVPADSPDQGPALLFEPGMTLQLAIKIINLEAGVVGIIAIFHVTCANEEALIQASVF